MKLYKNYEHSSISMIEDELFIDALKKCNASHILESGTFKGAGSTQMLANLNPEALYTIECDYTCFLEARTRLLKYPFVHCIYGLSVDKTEAIDFIKNDEEFLTSSDFFVDDENPVEFYLAEINGHLTGNSKKPPILDNLLLPILNRMKEHNPLILLDSAGGIGFLEFFYVIKFMERKNFSIVLDDTHHVKHARSRVLILNNSRFNVIYDNQVHGRMVAIYKQI